MSKWLGLISLAAVPACFETKVITPDSEEDGGGKTSASAGSHAGGAAGGTGFQSKACGDCQKAACASEYSKCDTACHDYYSCLFGCGTDAGCISRCTAPAQAIADATTLAACAAQSCTVECAPPIGAGGTTSMGSGGRSGSGGETLGSGGSATANGGALSGNGGAKASGGASFGGGPTGAGGLATSGVNWLTFENSRAPSSAAPNSDFGVDGVLYGYTDGCSSLTWDEETRCATGVLCDPGPTFSNWGAGVGFDFRNTGDEGTPPNTKRTWNPTEFGVRGVAWEITGVAPALQLWVLNMDPSYSGECSSTTCDIAGPPDGNPTPPLVGQLLFNNMRKDDWGGSGIVYSFDPAAVHALQFKLPAVIAGPATFAFCVKRVGLVK
jgi:hypothetical protein